MALSKMDIPPRAQHFLECGIEECERNCEFYCNPCHQRLCKQCRDEHLKSPDNKNHEVVIYQQRKRQLPVEKCKIHPTKDIDMLCEECQIPVCSKCVTQGNHQRHLFTDLETIYAEKYGVFQEEIAKVQNFFLPTSQDLQKEIKKDSSEIKHIMDNIRTSMKTEGETLKSLVDTVISENMKQLDQIEHSLLEDLNTQDKTMDDYITYLNNLDKELHICLSSTEPQKLLSEKQKIQPIPETTKPVTPGFTVGQYSKSDVTKLLGKIQVPNTKAIKREIRPMESVYNTAKKSTPKQMKENRKKSDMKKTMSLSTSVTKVREFNVPGVDHVYHVSLDQTDRLWISDNNGNLVQTDLQGNEIQKIKTSGGAHGYHTVTHDGDLIFTDKKKKVINRITQDNKITEFIKTGGWVPYSIHSSHINGDLLVGMRKDGEAKVTRYNKTGKELQNIQRDNKGQGLYEVPHYITENINGDICTSDFNNKAVVVVNKSGQHRFSYTGQKSGFSPYGICTDVLGHILVCDRNRNTVHLLDQDGQFLSLIITQQQGVNLPHSVCVDDENNLYVGQYNTNTLTVYKYLQ